MEPPPIIQQPPPIRQPPAIVRKAEPKIIAEHWDFPGGTEAEFRTHLVEKHGLTVEQVAGMHAGQLITAHDDAHAGTYEAILKRVMAGERVMTKVRIPGEQPGWHVCFLENGKPVFRDSPLAAQAVAAKKTFPSGGHHTGHDCPNCRYEQRSTPITGYVNGGHQHTCPNCKTSWWH